MNDIVWRTYIYCNYKLYCLFKWMSNQSAIKLLAHRTHVAPWLVQRVDTFITQVWRWENKYLPLCSRSFEASPESGPPRMEGHYFRWNKIFTAPALCYMATWNCWESLLCLKHIEAEPLIHWCSDKLVKISQMTFSRAWKLWISNEMSLKYVP